MTKPFYVRAPFDVTFERITPTHAAELLTTVKDATFETPGGLIHRNRNLSHGRVARYADDIQNGYWEIAHQGIAIDIYGCFIDEQHRLRAVVESGITCDFLPYAATLTRTYSG